MSVQQLHPPAAAARVATAQAEVRAAAAVPVWSVGGEELPRLLSDLTSLESQVAALKLSVLAEADRRRVADEAAATGTPAWAAQLTGTTRGVMAGGLWLAALLRDKYDATREAFADGGIDQAQARVIVKAAEKIPAQVCEDERRLAEEALVAKAVGGMNARGLRRAARRMLDVIDRDLADRQESEQLKDEERKAEARTELGLWDNGDGTFSGKFTIPELQGRMLRAALERLSAPRRLSRNKAGDVVHDDTADGRCVTWHERLGAAFAELIEHLPTQGHGAVAATLLVKISLEHLRDGLGAAGLDAGAVISAGETRRLACGAGIVPAVLGGRSEILDLGRMRRLHTQAMRSALSLEHDSCAAEGCERPFAWCEIHHPQPWSRGGETSVANGLPLCWHHHRRAHDDWYDMRRLPTGEVRFRWRRRRSATVAPRAG